jgi:tight adherence protein C
VTYVLLGGALSGLGVLILVLVFAPPRTSPAVALAQLDAARGRARTEQLVAARRAPGQLADSAHLWHIGGWLRTALSRTGVEFGGIRSDLSLLGRTLEAHLAVSVLAAVGGFLAPVLVQLVIAIFVGGSPGGVSLAVGLFFGAIAGLVPTLTVRSKAADRRRDFRHVVSSFLDLVAMNLAGGRGVPEALQSASEITDDWAMVRIRDTLLSARLHGVTPWAALGELGEEIQIDELRDLAASLALVAEDGAKVRESLTARAVSMRKRELAEAEGKAGEKSQSMLVAQLLLALGFLIFLVYPATVRMLGF